MTRQDFELIARVLRSNQDSRTKAFEKYHAQICHDFADELQETDSSFDRARFLKACGQ